MLKTTDFSPNPFERPAREPQQAASKEVLGNQLKNTEYAEMSEHIGMIYTIAHKYRKTYGNDYALYDEMVQELFLRLPKIKEKYNPEFGKLRPFMSKYLGYESIKVWQNYNKGREASLPETFDLEVQNTDLEDLVKTHKYDRLMEEIQKLEDFERWVLTKKFLEKHTYEQIRVLWNNSKPFTKRRFSVRTFYVHTQKAITKLREALQDIEKDI